ncbi:MAG: phage terminase large subunit [Halobacteriota archaeon]
MSRHQSRISRLERHRKRYARDTDLTRVEIPDDPVAFARLLGIEPDPWQRDLLTSTEGNVILNCARQSGKSTIVAVLALCHALVHPRSLVLILSPSQRQSGELLKKITDFYCELGRPGGSNANSATTLLLKNGSRIVALPGSESTTRGFSAPSLVLVDEAAQVSDELYQSVRPMLAVSQGRLVLLSTPRGKQGVFWHAWDQEPHWHRVRVTADQCPRIAPEFLERERRVIGEYWYAQEYLCEFLQNHAAVFKEAWVQHYDPDDLPQMDTIIQSWDTAQTKSSTSDYVVGQVWGRKDAHFYLLDQVRGRFDFDETVQAIRDLSAKWPDSTAKVVEAQILGVAISTHLKHQIPGLIPIHVKDTKEYRARNCVPLWQCGNVYLPRPDYGACEWVREYVHELLTFPNAAHDDQVDATTLALNQLRGTLFPESKACVVANIEARVQYNHDYVIGWIPGRFDESSTLVVYDRNTNAVVHFERTPAEVKITRVRELSKKFDAAVRAFDGYDEAMLKAARSKGAYVRRVKFTPQELAAAYENLGMLIRKRVISYPLYPDLIAELDVFKSELTFSGTPDYSLQVAQQSGVQALCLATYDVDPEHPILSDYEKYEDYYDEDYYDENDYDEDDYGYSFVYGHVGYL